MQDWDSLRYILAVAREGGLSGAARVLGVNHATVSRQIARAEDRAGLRLFDRLPGGLSPTEAGRLAVARAEAIERETLALDLAFAAEAQDEVALTVTIPPLVADVHFANDIQEFHRLNPRIKLSVSGENRILNLHRREADVAIRVSHEPTESLWGRVIARQNAAWYATPEFVARQPGLNGDASAPIPVVSFPHWKPELPDSLRNIYPNASIMMQVDDMPVAMSFVRSGAAMTRMPHFLGASHADLVRVPGLPLIDYMPIWALTHPDLRRTAHVAGFMSFIADRFAARAALFLGSDEALET